MRRIASRRLLLLPCTVDSSVDLVVIMPEKVPVCFLCSFRADSPNPLLVLVLDAEVSYRPWMSYNKVYKGKNVIGKKPTGCVCVASVATCTRLLAS